MDMNNIILVIALIIVAFVSGMTLKEKLLKITKRVKSKTRVIRDYWIFVVIFTCVSAILYFVLFKWFIETEHIELYLSTLNTILGLIFAIFVGYFAFLQVVESRVDRIILEADELVDRGQLKRAILKYEEVLKMCKDNFGANSNLAELYLIEEKDEFSGQMELLESILTEPREFLVYYYLKAANFLLKQELGEAKKIVKKIVDFVNNEPTALSKFNWRFHELKDSKIYKELPKGEAKKIMDNLIEYLLKALSDSNRISFESGNYRLDREEGKAKSSAQKKK